MENLVRDKCSDYDFLSQSYTQGIERITGQKDFVNFTLPRSVIKIREKAWDNLFDKYSDMMSDDIELNVDTLEPEIETEEEYSEETHNSKQHVIMRKSQSVIQYWVDTGNLPYKAFLEEKASNQSDSSLSEKEMTSLSQSPHQILRKGDKQKHRSDSSCSSVDTAAYILSNANITKKADTIAIIEGAKHTNIKPTESDPVLDSETASNDKTSYRETVRIDDRLHNGNSNINTNVSDSLASHSMSIHEEQTDGQLNNIATNTANSNVSSRKLFHDKTNNTMSNVNQNMDLQNTNDIASIFRQLDKMSKRTSENNKSASNTLNQDKISKMCNSSHMSKNIGAEETIMDTNFKPIRKKLFTNRSSPVDLILMKECRTSVLSTEEINLHPALDPSDMSEIKRSSILNHKKKQQLSKMKLKKSNIKKRKKRISISNNSISKTSITSDDTNQYFADIDSFSKDLLNSQNSNRKNDNNLRINCNTNITESNIDLKNIESTRDLVPHDLNPVVVLERIKPTLIQHNLRLAKDNTGNTVIVQENNVHNNKHLNRLNACINMVENIDLKSVDSNISTIIMYECQENASKSSSLNDSFDLQLNAKNYHPISSTRRKDDKLWNLIRTDRKLNQKPRVVLKYLSQSVIKNYTKLKTQNAKQISSTKDQLSNTQKEILSNKMHSSDSYEHTKVYKKDNVKLREIKVELQQLSDALLSRKNIANAYISPNKKNIQSTTKFTNHENMDTSVQETCETKDVYTLRSKSKKSNDRIYDEFNAAAKHEIQIYNGVKSVSAIQNQINEIRRNRNRKEVCLTCISSDEDDFVQIIRSSKKKMRLSSSKTLIETNVIQNNSPDKTKKVNTSKDNHRQSCNLSTAMNSSGEVNAREMKKSTLKEHERSKAKTKSSDSRTSTEISPFFRNKNDYKNNNCTENVDKQRKISLFSNTYYNKNISNNDSTRHAATAVKEHDSQSKCNIDCAVSLYRINTSDTKSSFSNKSSNDTSPSMTLKASVRYRDSVKSRYRNRTNNVCMNFNVKKNTDKQLSLLNSAIMYNVSDHISNVRSPLKLLTDSASCTKKQIRKSYNINLRSRNTVKDKFCSSVTNNVPVEEDNAISSESNYNSNCSLKEEEIFTEFNFCNDNQPSNLESRKMLTFQTKSYHDSDSSEC